MTRVVAKPGTRIYQEALKKAWAEAIAADFGCAPNPASYRINDPQTAMMPPGQIEALNTAAQKLKEQLQIASQQRRDCVPAPALLTYPEFHKLAAAAVTKFCPRAKLITDAIVLRCKPGFMAEVTHKKAYARIVCTADEPLNSIQSMLDAMCTALVRSCGMFELT